jgi:CBS domain containing-hemolysin-like protein
VVAVVLVVVVAPGFTIGVVVVLMVAVVVAAGFAGGAEVAVAASAPGSAPAPVVSAGGVFVSAAASNPSFPLTTMLLEITVIKFVNIKVVINTIVMFLLKYVDMNPTDKNINKA